MTIKANHMENKLKAMTLKITFEQWLFLKAYLNQRETSFQRFGEEIIIKEIDK